MRAGKHMILGILFLLIGLSILLKAVFHIDIPLARTGFALFIIYIGVKMLMGGFGWRSSCRWEGKGEGREDAAVFTSKDFKISESDKESKQYSVVFGSSTIDLTALPPDRKADTHVEVNTVFGEGVVLLSRKQPVQIRANAVFGEAKTPNENMVAFGTLQFESPERKAAEAGRLVIHGNVVFGSLRFVYQD
jgi:predicted membrane protein